MASLAFRAAAQGAKALLLSGNCNGLSGQQLPAGLSHRFKMTF